MTEIPFKPIFIVMMILITSLGLPGCKSYVFVSKTVNHEIVDYGFVSLKSGGFGNDKEIACQNAVQAAFKSILIYGIPDSNQAKAMLGSSAMTVYTMKRKFFESFLENDTDKFIVKKKIKGFRYVDDDSPSTEVELLINLSALKQYLKENSIIR